MNKPFALTLFSTDPEFIRCAVAAGVSEIIVDWECRGKELRQAEADTEINEDSLEDLLRVRRSTDARILCRLNGFGEGTEPELEDAIRAGADEILLPMVESPREVEAVLGMAGGRCGVGIMVETISSLKCARDLGQLPISRVFVGLNDLAIARRTPNIFTAVRDGTVDRVREHFSAPFGFGGLTLPECGHPIPCALLIAALARLECGFSFLRRSFRRDIRGRDMNAEVPRILAALARAFCRSPDEVERDNAELHRVLDLMPHGLLQR